MKIEGKKCTTNGAWVLFKRQEQLSCGKFENHENWDMGTMMGMRRKRSAGIQRNSRESETSRRELCSKDMGGTTSEGKAVQSKGP